MTLGWSAWSHTWMGCDRQTQHQRTIPGTSPVCTASRPKSFQPLGVHLVPTEHTNSSKPEFSIHPSIALHELQKPLRSQSKRNCFRWGKKEEPWLSATKTGKQESQTHHFFPRPTTTLPTASNPAAAEHPSRPKLQQTAAAFQSKKQKQINQCFALMAS